MTRILLQALNAPALVLIAILGIAVQTSLFALWPLNYFQPDVVLLIVIWCALRRNFIEGGILTLIVSHLAEIHSAVPRGTFNVSYMLVYLLVRGSSRMVVIPDLSSFVIVTLFSSLIMKLSSTAIINLLSPHSYVLRNTAFLLFPGAAVAGLLSIWGYQWLEKFDSYTYKNSRSAESLEQDLNLDSEGF